MYRFLGESDTLMYFVMGTIADWAFRLFCLLQFKEKEKCLGTYSQLLIYKISKGNPLITKIARAFFVVFELYLLTELVILVIGNFNRSFGEAMDTGANYFGMLLTISFFIAIFCFALSINPLKQMDFLALVLPPYLFLAKIACFCAGCCHGVYWEHGMYNHKFDELQVPVQLIEAFWTILILIFLLLYRKKAKGGTLLPIYIILYCATRFCSEFFRAEPNVLGVLKTYHILCIVGIILGIFELALVSQYRDTINAYFDKKQENINLKIEEIKNNYAKNKN